MIIVTATCISACMPTNPQPASFTAQLVVQAPSLHNARLPLIRHGRRCRTLKSSMLFPFVLMWRKGMAVALSGQGQHCSQTCTQRENPPDRTDRSRLS
jgi:hypothetical protein